MKYRHGLVSGALALVLGADSLAPRGRAASPGAEAVEHRAVVTDRLPDDASIRAMLQQRIDQEKRHVGIVVGVLDTNGSRVVTYGQSGKPGRPQVDGDTLFE